MSDQPHLLALTISGQDMMPVAFHAEESISAPFVLTVDAVTQTPVTTPGSLLYQPACLSVQKGADSRYFNGMIQSITASGMPVRGMWRYTLSIVPKLWFMSQTSDCRIFQAQTVGQILTTICGENSQTLTLNIYGDQTTLDYVTQYNETDLAFISRLMEQAGLYYFFQHSDSDHTMIVTDQNQGFPSSPKPTMYVIHEGNNPDVFSQWQQTTATAFGKITLLDYDPSQASPLNGNQPTTFTSVAGVSLRDVTRWPALSFVSADVSSRANIDISAAEAEAALTQAIGSNLTFSAGSRFTLAKDPISGATSVDYVVRTVVHSGQDETWVAGDAEPSYDNSLTAFPMSVPWRQRLVVPRPVMAGVFAAIVIGNSGEEIHADSMARVKVRLMWDHRADTVADQAIWVRIITPWAGNSWGIQHLPRVGTEVAVAFMDGDPDRPVMVGGFYNVSMSPIFPVPGQQTKSGFRSRSTTQGSTSNFSEFSFDDNKGSELVYLHAEKDMTTEVENNDSLTVSNAQTITIAKGRTTTVQDQGDKLTVQGGDLTVEVSKGNYSMTVDQGKHETTVSTGDMTSTVSTGKHTTTVSTADMTTTVSMGNHTTTVSMGNVSIQASLGAVNIQAMQKISLTVGGNSITIDPTGVSIKGTMVQIEGEAMLTAKAPMTQLQGEGMLMVKGGIVMIN